MDKNDPGYWDFLHALAVQETAKALGRIGLKAGPPRRLPDGRSEFEVTTDTPLKE